MDRHEEEHTNQHTTRTDLSLLLECLKFQMKCPDLQKQAMLTILSICEKREANVEMLREMGGVTFLLNLSKSNFVQSDVKETALFTLGTLAEANVYCKNSLCRKEIFTDLADWLVAKDAPLTKKRVIVYLLSVLVVNNKLGQTLVQNTGCLDILLNLFRATFPLSAEGTFKTANSTQLLQLWKSLSSALCGCVNNPHNEEGQRVCVSVFPTVKKWIQQISLPQTEIFHPLCLFISMTVANNSCVQESFAASGGLEHLTLALIRFSLGSETSALACQLAVSTSKTLSACISDNSAIASQLAKYQVVCHLFSLLINPRLDSDDRLSVLLTLAHCTEASEEHQKQLVLIGSLPVIITLLTEDSSDEVRKAAMFILHTCKQATNALGIPDIKEKITESSSNLDSYIKSAKEICQRLDELEKKQAKAEQELLCLQQESPLSAHSLKEEDSEGEEEPLIVKANRNLRRSLQEEPKAEKPLWPPFNRAAPRLCFVHPAEGAREPQRTRELVKAPQSTAPHDCSLVEGCVLRFDEVTSHTFTCLQSSCAHSCDMHRALRDATERYASQDMRALTRQPTTPLTRHPTTPLTRQPTTPRSRRVPAPEPQKNQKNWSGVRLTPFTPPGPGRGFAAAGLKENHKDMRLTPLHKGMKTAGLAFCQTLAPVRSAPERPRAPKQNAEKNKRKPFGDDEKFETAKISSKCVSQRRRRQDFSREEELYLLRGVKTYGPSWNAILWSYPFQPGRTNVDLAQKYRRLRVTAQHPSTMLRGEHP